MEVLVLIVLLGLAAGAIASSKGRSFFGYFLLGTFIPVFGLILAAALPKVEQNLDRRMVEKGERRACPFCAELIRPGAVVCRFCGRDLAVSVDPRQVTPPAPLPPFCNTCKAHHAPTAPHAANHWTVG